MTKKNKSNKKSFWQTETDRFNREKMTEPLFITTSLTPEDADILLEDVSHNRNAYQRLITRYKDYMDEDSWGLNGETIKVSSKGLLLDGQHRLYALRLHGHPVKMSMALGIKESLFAITDVGKARTAGDILKIAGYKNVNQNSAALHLILRYKMNESMASNASIPQSKILDAMNKWPHIDEYSRKAGQFKHIINVTTVQFMMFITRRIDESASNDFFAKLLSGEKLGKTSSILHLRNYHVGIKAKNLFLDKRHGWASIILAWNAYYQNERVSSVKWDGKEFPIIVGADRKKLFLKR